MNSSGLTGAGGAGVLERGSRKLGQCSAQSIQGRWDKSVLGYTVFYAIIKYFDHRVCRDMFRAEPDDAHSCKCSAAGESDVRPTEIYAMRQTIQNKEDEKPTHCPFANVPLRSTLTASSEAPWPTKLHQ